MAKRIEISYKVFQAFSPIYVDGVMNKTPYDMRMYKGRINKKEKQNQPKEGKRSYFDR